MKKNWRDMTHEEYQKLTEEERKQIIAEQIIIKTEFAINGKVKVSVRGDTRPHKDYLAELGYAWKQNPESISILKEKKLSPCRYKYLSAKSMQAAINKEMRRLRDVSIIILPINDEYNKFFYDFGLKDAFAVKNDVVAPQNLDEKRVNKKENRQSTKTFINAEILRVLAVEVGKKSLSELKIGLPFSNNLVINIENSDFYAVLWNGKNSIEILIKNRKHKTLLSARIAQYQTPWGRKIYAEHYAYDGWTEYDKVENSNVMKLFAYAALTIAYAYSHPEECPPVEFTLARDMQTGDDVLNIKILSNRKQAKVLEEGENTKKIARDAAASSRKSPEEPFGVRGHYRHLKSGKTVWVKSYEKGKK